MTAPCEALLTTRAAVRHWEQVPGTGRRLLNVSSDSGLFGEPGYTIRDVVRHVAEGTPLGVRVIEAERKLVGLLLTEALDAEGCTR